MDDELWLERISATYEDACDGEAINLTIRLFAPHNPLGEVDPRVLDRVRGAVNVLQKILADVGEDDADRTAHRWAVCAPPTGSALTDVDDQAELLRALAAADPPHEAINMLLRDALRLGPAPRREATEATDTAEVAAPVADDDGGARVGTGANTLASSPGPPPSR